MPWHGNLRGVGLARRKMSVPEAAAAGDKWSRGRSRGLLLLEDQARNPPDRHAVVDGLPQRSADLDTSSVPETHGQASARCGAGLDTGHELGPGCSAVEAV